MNTDRSKFRVWDKRKKRYDDRYVIGDDGWAYQLSDVGDDWYGLNANEEVIIEHCTGLKDENGNLIYEGDVLESDMSVTPVYVQWSYDDCRFVLKRFDVKGWNISLTQENASMYTITGNIHEGVKK